MKRLIYIALLSLAACGRVYQVNSDFQPYVAEFERLSVKKIDSLIIEYGESRGGGAGATCYQDFGKTPTIKVDEWTWKQLGEGTRKQIILHEMGHCVLNRDHSTERGDANCPVSLMTVSPVSEWCLNHYGWEFYETELFK